MVVYYFNPKIVDKLTKIKVIAGPRTNYNGTRWEVSLHPDDDPRKYSFIKDIHGRSYLMDVSRTEGEVYRCKFWLEEENDEKAKQIYENWIEEQINKEKEKLYKLKEKYGV